MHISDHICLQGADATYYAVFELFFGQPRPPNIELWAIKLYLRK